MSHFSDKFGGRLQGERVHALRGMVAAKIKVVAEQEIQRILGEVEGRLRAAIRNDIVVEIGQLQYEFDDLAQNGKVNVAVHMTSRKHGEKATAIDISDPSRLLR